MWGLWNIWQELQVSEFKTKTCNESELFLAAFIPVESRVFTAARVVNTQHVSFALCMWVHVVMPCVPRTAAWNTAAWVRDYRKFRLQGFYCTYMSSAFMEHNGLITEKEEALIVCSDQFQNVSDGRMFGVCSVRRFDFKKLLFKLLTWVSFKKNNLIKFGPELVLNILLLFCTTYTFIWHSIFHIDYIIKTLIHSDECWRCFMYYGIEYSATI